MNMTELEKESQQRFLKHIDECDFCNRFIGVTYQNGKPRKYLSGMEWRKCRTVQMLFDEYDVPPDISGATW